MIFLYGGIIPLTDNGRALIRITSDKTNGIKVDFAYDAAVVAKVKTIRNRRWHPNGKYWSFPNTAAKLNEILTIFADEHLDIDPVLNSGGIKPVQETSVNTFLLDRVRHPPEHR